MQGVFSLNEKRVGCVTLSTLIYLIQNGGVNCLFDGLEIFFWAWVSRLATFSKRWVLSQRSMWLGDQSSTFFDHVWLIILKLTVSQSFRSLYNLTY